MPEIPLTRSHVRLANNPERVITKPYVPADDGPGANPRAKRLINRILTLPPDEAADTLAEIRRRFGQRHAELDEVFLRGFWAVAHLIPDVTDISDETRRLVGSYFMHEYSLEGAALTNPSIVPDFDQSGVPDGSLRIIVSLRAVGEGHISSIEFRSGLVDHNGNIDIAPPLDPITGDRQSPILDKAIFTTKLNEMNAVNDLVGRVLVQLEDRFTTADLDAALTNLGGHEGSSTAVHHVIQIIRWLASSNYELTFPPHSELSRRVLFPNGPTESHGMEDARLVRFVETDGSVVYYATYTAYDGFNILPQLIETADFQNFRIATLNGPAAVNKGIAIFPRRIDGRYAALARCDGESNYVMLSDHIRTINSPGE